MQYSQICGIDFLMISSRPHPFFILLSMAKVELTPNPENLKFYFLDFSHNSRLSYCFNISKNFPLLLLFSKIFTTIMFCEFQMMFCVNCFEGDLNIFISYTYSDFLDLLQQNTEIYEKSSTF